MSDHKSEEAISVRTLPDGRRHLSGTKATLDAAQVWARAVLVSVLGPEEGEKAYRTLPALPVLLAYRKALYLGGVN